MKYEIKPLSYSYTSQLISFFERSLEKSSTNHMKIQIENYNGNIKTNLLEYLIILDNNGICDPHFVKETPEFLKDFLNRTYSFCHNYMVDHPEEIDD